jgi:hypothetical protein
MQESLFITDKRLSNIKHATTEDSSLQTLMSTIKEGWPDNT